MSVFQVEGAVTRAYNRWIEDLTSLPEYQASLQREKEKWQQVHKELTEQRVSCFSWKLLLSDDPLFNPVF